MNMQCFWVGLHLFCGFFVVGFCDQDGFLSISCGGNTSYIDSSKISWVPDGEYVSTGNITTVVYIEGTSTSNVPIRYFPNTQDRQCYRLPVNNVSSLVLVRARFLYQ